MRGPLLEDLLHRCPREEQVAPVLGHEGVQPLHPQLLQLQAQPMQRVAARCKRHTRDVRLGIVFLYESLHSSHPHVLASS